MRSVALRQQVNEAFGMMKHERPLFRVPYGSDHAVPGEVTDTGTLKLSAIAELDAATACAFARWIIDTFGESE